MLGLYVLFIGRMQSDGIAAALAEFGVTADDAVRAFSDSWMLSGVMATTCITVPLCACGTMIQDRIKGVSADCLASPVPSWAAPAAYFLSVLIAGAAISLVVLGVCFAYLALSGSWFLTVAEVFGAIGTALLSVVASSTMLVFLMGFLQSEGAFTGINIIVGTVTGFLIGAYIPISSFPEWVQYITLFVPGSYSAGLFRGFLMQGTLGEMERIAGKPFADALSVSSPCTSTSSGCSSRLGRGGHPGGRRAAVCALFRLRRLFAREEASDINKKKRAPAGRHCRPAGA